MTLPTIEELAPGTRIRIKGCQGEMVVLHQYWVADLFFNPPSLSELAPGTQAEQFHNGLTWENFIN